MILDAEGAFREYLENNILDIIGNGNDTVEIYEGYIPNDANESAISVFAEIPGESDVHTVYPVGIRIITRSSSKASAFALIQNIDLLLDRSYGANLNDGVALCECYRNSGPDHFEGEENSLHHYSVLFSTTLRKR